MSKDTKTALMDFAEHAARARGFDGFSYADMAEAVGMRKASVHYHFPTKADLSVALMDRYYTDLEQACTQINATHETGAEQLKALIAVYRLALNHGKTLCLCVSFTASRESLPVEVTLKIGAFRKMMVTWIQAVFELGRLDGTIENARSAPQEALPTLAQLEGAHLAARAEESLAVFDRTTELLAARCQSFSGS